MEIAILVIFFLVIGTYSYLKMKSVIDGPKVSIISPENWSATETGVTLVRGTARNISSLSLNDRVIFTDENGDFSEKVALLPGYNILSVKGADKFGKKTEAVVKLVRKE